MAETPREIKDDGFKTILGNHELFVQLLRDFVKIDFLKDVKPEDIEDITERFIVMGIDSQDGDTVKKIRLENHEPLFVIGIAEHQQKVSYRMSFRMLQYCVFIWINYEREQNELRKNASELKDFKYPPILPIVYYAGDGRWTAPKNFYEKVHFNTVFEKYIPKFEYLLIDSNDYTQLDLVKNKDILSLFLLIDKIKKIDGMELSKEIPAHWFDEIEETTPEHLRELVREVIFMFFVKLDAPPEERDYIANRIKKRRFSEMFTLLEEYSITKTRDQAKREQREETSIEIAKNLLRDNFDIKAIAKATNLPIEKVTELKNCL